MPRYNHPIRLFLFRLVLVFYVVSILKPLKPIAGDMLAHCFWEMEHLATIHVEHGKFHVHAEIAQEEKNTSSPKKSTTAQNEVFSDTHIRALVTSIPAPTHKPAHFLPHVETCFDNPLRVISSPPPEC
jgi:hypothetical protein